MDMPLRSLSKFADSYYIKEGLKNPRKAVRTLRGQILTKKTTGGDPTAYDDKREAALASLCDVKTEQIESWIEEVRTGWVNERLSECESVMEQQPYRIGGMRLGGETAYAVTRLLEPESVCEVGVANGVSTLYVLGALRDSAALDADVVGLDRPHFESEYRERRNKRALHDATGIIPDDREAGWFCPIELKRQFGYQYYAADIAVLPEVVETIDSLDLALYDASKEADDMQRAYETLIDALEPGGVLVSDDVAVNDVFDRVTDHSPGKAKTVGGIGIYRHGI